MFYILAVLFGVAGGIYAERKGWVKLALAKLEKIADPFN